MFWARKGTPAKNRLLRGLTKTLHHPGNYPSRPLQEPPSGQRKVLEVTLSKKLSKPRSEPVVILVGDGACSRSSGGWAYLLRLPDGTVLRDSGHEPFSTSNRMEITALLKGLNRLLSIQNNFLTKVLVFSDSTYTLRGMARWAENWRSQNWKLSTGGNVKNRDLWESFLRLKPKFSHLVFQHVPRNSTEDHTWCDSAAKAASKPKPVQKAVDEHVLVTNRPFSIKDVKTTHNRLQQPEITDLLTEVDVVACCVGLESTRGRGWMWKLFWPTGVVETREDVELENFDCNMSLFSVLKALHWLKHQTSVETVAIIVDDQFVASLAQKIKDSLNPEMKQFQAWRWLVKLSKPFKVSWYSSFGFDVTIAMARALKRRMKAKDHFGEFEHGQFNHG